MNSQETTAVPVRVAQSIVDEIDDITITVRVRLGKIRPLDIQLLLTPDAMVIQGEHGPTPQKLFRTVQFPRRIDVGKAEIKYENGFLILTA